MSRKGIKKKQRKRKKRKRKKKDTSDEKDGVLSQSSSAVGTVVVRVQGLASWGRGFLPWTI